MQQILLYQGITILLAPLIGGLITGIYGRVIGRTGAHILTISLVFVSFILSCNLLYQFMLGFLVPVELKLYTFFTIGWLKIDLGMMLDSLTALMLVIVTSISLVVHVYTVGYMHDDPGYQRFFSYISLFTFAMLTLIVANNFLQLFFGWEAVGLISYLLIGFWYTKESAIKASLKAFLVNRIGDLGFLLGIAAVFCYFGSLNYTEVFAQAKELSLAPIVLTTIFGLPLDAITITCLLLFIGAMGKSAQVPLHIWLPDSMEGPTPISALIHAATMVTAGIFMVARLSPIFEYSEIALSVMLFIGAITCILMGIAGSFQEDIKRIIAYSTLSQLGYMVAALGVSAYSFSIFHLMTHAFFKALLFLGAGSVIMAMHHEQSIFKMGGLYKYMPLTYITMLIAGLSLMGMPLFSGFYSKDLIIVAVNHSTLFGATFAAMLLNISVFFTALYTCRLIFLVFHTEERMEDHLKHQLTESKAIIWLPLVCLAVPALTLGFIALPYVKNFFGNAILVLPAHNQLATFLVGSSFEMAQHAMFEVPFKLMLAGIVCSWLLYIQFPKLAGRLKYAYFPTTYAFIKHGYGFDHFNQQVIVGLTKFLSMLTTFVDKRIIDGMLVNGTAKLIYKVALMFKKRNNGYLYNYALYMVSGLVVLLICLLH